MCECVTERPCEALCATERVFTAVSLLLVGPKIVIIDEIDVIDVIDALLPVT